MENYKGQIVTDFNGNSYRVISTHGEELKVVQYCTADSILNPKISYLVINDIKEIA